MYFLAYVSNIYIPLTLNDADMKGGSAVRHPHSPELHPAPVPARVLLRQVAHAHGEHVLSGVIRDRRPSLPVRGWIRVIGAREARAELPHPALTPVLHVTDVLRVYSDTGQWRTHPPAQTHLLQCWLCRDTLKDTEHFNMHSSLDLTINNIIILEAWIVNLHPSSRNNRVKQSSCKYRLLENNLEYSIVSRKIGDNLAIILAYKINTFP